MRYVQTVKNPEERSQPRHSLGRAKASKPRPEAQKGLTPITNNRVRNRTGRDYRKVVRRRSTNTHEKTQTQENRGSVKAKPVKSQERLTCLTVQCEAENKAARTIVQEAAREASEKPRATGKDTKLKHRK
jgi:hypothetical protein